MNKCPSNSLGRRIDDLLFGSYRYTGPAMIERPPEPRLGKRSLFTLPYQINAGCAGGSFLMPVLFGE